MSAERSCSVVDSINCERPPGYPRMGRLAECYSCGDDTCLSCSSLVAYRGRYVRMCFTCQDMRGLRRLASR